MKPSANTRTDGPNIIVASEVARLIRQHAHAHMNTEVCGVLIGSIQSGVLHVEACIAGRNAAQAGTHVTFTQDTWEYIYKVKDEEYSESRIVGWYHSHPGFGIFLSEHDAFIHRNFFSAREQIAWVYDPHNDEEGFFGWTNERITRVGHVTFSDPRGGEDSAKDESPIRSKAVAEDDVEGSPSVAVGPYTGSSRWLQWVVSVLSYVLAIAVGFLIAWFLFPRIIAIGVPVDPRTGVPLVNVPDRVLMQKAQPPAITNSLQPKTEPPDSSKKPQAASEAKSAQ